MSMRYTMLVVMIALMPALATAKTDIPTYVTGIEYTLEQPFGGTASVTNVGEYLQLVYQFALAIVGIFAVVLIMFGGLRWISAAGNESVIGEAKEIIISATTGLVIALLSYTILLFINPRLTDLSLNVLTIPKTFQDVNIVDLKPCTEAAFKGQTCIVSGTSSSQNCEALTCNEIGLYNGQYCRGISCASGTGSCDRGPVDPSQYSCQNYYCGKYAQDCADKNYKDMPSASVSFESAYHECTCQYYEEVVAPLVGLTTLDSAQLSAAQQALFYGFCTEQTLQASWITEITSDPGSYGNATAPGTRGWNCGFGCYNVGQALEYTGGLQYLNCPVNTQ